MKVAIIGSGGREHALAWKLNESENISSILAIPGNDAMERTLSKVKCFDMPSLDSFGKAKLVELLTNEKVSYVVIGPEAPLVAGFTDALHSAGIPVFGPTEGAAQLEGSKRFAKEFMKRYHIPTAKYATFTDVAEALEYIEQQGAPIVIKADGLAAGKGVVVAHTIEDARIAVERFLLRHEFGCNEIVIEEFLEGEEVTLLCFSDGVRVAPMIPSRDHKRIFDGDKGPNTGGMGAFAPASIMTKDLLVETMKTIVEPTIYYMHEEEHPFVGCLYVGLIITSEGPKVIEYNARFGDPETQVVLPLLETDFAFLCKDCAEGNLKPESVKWRNQSTACVIMASAGYPETATKGCLIEGELGEEVNSIIFHSGTKYNNEQDCYMTNGGRVLAVVGMGSDLREALQIAYSRVEKIHFQGMQYRKDIGKKL